MPFIAPEFAQYDSELAEQMTEWLYSDPDANPYWKDPSRWSQGPRVAMVWRRVAFSDLVYGGVANRQTKTLQTVFGGRNAVLFAQSATVVPTSVAVSVLPNQYGAYVEVSQELGNGVFEIEETPVHNVFSTIPGQPTMLPTPKFWYGPDARTFKATNYGDIASGTVDLTLNFLGAVLDTAR